MDLDILNIIKRVDLLKGLLNIESTKLFEQTLLDFVNNSHLDKIEISFYEEALKQCQSNNNSSAIEFLDTLRNNSLLKIFDKPCNKSWDDLLPINNSDEKYCTECSRNVYMVYNKIDYRKRKELNQCVAINFNLKEIYSKSSGCDIPVINEQVLLGSPLIIDDEK